MIFGGTDYERRVAVIDPFSSFDRYRELTVLPEPTVNASAVRVGGDHFLFGAGTLGTSIYRLRYSPWDVSLVRVGASLPEASTGTTAVWTGSAAYIFGVGCLPGELDCVPGSRIARFDPATEAITILPARLPGARRLAASVWTGSHVLLFGGEDLAGTDAADVLRFDPATGELVRMSQSLPQPDAGLAATWDGSSAFVYGLGSANRDVVRYDVTPAAPTALSGAIAQMRLPDGETALRGDLTWAPPAGNTYARPLSSYRVFRAVDGGPEALIGEVPATQPAFSDHSISVGTSYTYRVSAVAGSESPKSAALSLLSPVAHAPRAVHAVAGPGAGQISLDWKEPTAATSAVLSYRIYRDGGLALEVPGNLRSYVDVGHGEAATHSYRVSAVVAEGEGRASGEHLVTTFGRPGVPQSVGAVNSSLGEVTVSWVGPTFDGGTPITTFRLYRTVSGRRALIASTDSGTMSYVDRGCPRGAVCSYQVTASNLVGEGAPSASPTVIGT